MVMSFPAHIRTLSSPAVQTVEQHNRKAAEYASVCLKSCGLSQTAYLAGLLHDCGKYTTAYAEYLQKAVNGEAVQRSTVNHSFAGVRLRTKYYDTWKRTISEKLTDKPLAW